MVWIFRLTYNSEDVRLLPERDEIKGTKTAHMDMSTRQAAIRASHMTGGIFGLLLKLELVVEQEA